MVASRYRQTVCVCEIVPTVLVPAHVTDTWLPFASYTEVQTVSPPNDFVVIVTDRAASSYDISMVPAPPPLSVPAVGRPALSHAVYVVVAEPIVYAAAWRTSRFWASYEFVTVPLAVVPAKPLVCVVARVERVSGGTTRTSSMKSFVELYDTTVRAVPAPPKLSE
jgi:hypothetical protein